MKPKSLLVQSPPAAHYTDDTIILPKTISHDFKIDRALVVENRDTGSRSTLRKTCLSCRKKKTGPAITNQD